MELSPAIFSLKASETLKLADSLGLTDIPADVTSALGSLTESATATLLPPSVQGEPTGSGTVAASSGKSEANPNNPESNTPPPEMIISGGFPEQANGALVGLAGLLDICSPASTDDIRGANASKGKVEDPYCCDCGDGGVPVVGGGYILLKTLDKIRELQKGRLSNIIKQYKSGRMNDGQALLGITGVLNKALHSKNGDLIPTAITLPIGQEGVKISMRDAVKRSDMDWIKAAKDGLGGGVVGPIIGENMGMLTGGLLTRGDTKGISTLTDMMPDWSKSILPGSMTGKASGYKTNGLTDEQAKDVLIAASVNDKRTVTA